MKNNNSKIEPLIKKVVKKVVEGEEAGWPPGCATLLFQPQRPVRETEKKEK